MSHVGRFLNPPVNHKRQQRSNGRHKDFGKRQKARARPANLIPWPGPHTTLRISTSVVPVCSDMQSSPASPDQLSRMYHFQMMNGEQGPDLVFHAVSHNRGYATRKQEVNLPLDLDSVVSREPSPAQL